MSYSSKNSEKTSTTVGPVQIVLWALSVFTISAMLVVFIVLGSWGIGAFGRNQAIAAANNQAHVNIIQADNNVQKTQIEIQNQTQQIQVTKQQAQIRLQQAVGIREAQDEINQTLTPLYIEWEETQALEQVATSGKNNTVIYIPSGQGGIPTITAQAGTGK